MLDLEGRLVILEPEKKAERKLKKSDIDQFAPRMTYQRWPVIAQEKQAAANSLCRMPAIYCHSSEALHSLVGSNNSQRCNSPDNDKSRVKGLPSPDRRHSTRDSSLSNTIPFQNRRSSCSAMRTQSAMTRSQRHRQDNESSIGRGRTGHAERQEECVICMEAYKDEDVVRQASCDHVFHGGCIEKWLTSGDSSCPLCKDEMMGQSGLDGPDRGGRV